MVMRMRLSFIGRQEDFLPRFRCLRSPPEMTPEGFEAKKTAITLSHGYKGANRFISARVDVEEDR
jgi:hypothetical protein